MHRISQSRRILGGSIALLIVLGHVLGLVVGLGAGVASAQGPFAVTLSAPTLAADPGDTVTVDIEVTSLENVDALAAIKIAARFDPFVLTAVDAAPGALLVAWPASDFSFTVSEDRLSVSALTGSSVPIGLGELLRLRFVVRDDAVDGATSPLDLTGTDPGQAIVLLATPDQEPPGLKTVGEDGALTVTGGITCDAGDANPTGTVDVSDAIVILRIVTGLLTDPSGDQRCGADADRNGAIDTGDAVWVLRSVVGLPVTPAAGASAGSLGSPVAPPMDTSAPSVPSVRLQRTARGAQLVIEPAHELFGLEMRLTGDGAVVAAELGPAARGLRIQSLAGAGRRVAWASGEALVAAGEALIVDLPVAWIAHDFDDAARSGRLSLASLRLFDGRGQVMTAEMENATVMLTRDAVTPVVRPLALNGFPNPFNPSTTLSFELPRAGATRLEIFNAAGARVAVLVDGALASGNHEVVWNGTDLSGRIVSSGVYFARLTAEGASAHRRLLLVK